MKTRQHVSYRWFLLAAISATALAMPTAHSQPVDEPVPLRRIWLDPERLPDEMKRVRLGVLKQLPLADFEALIRRAGRATAALKEPVRLIEARYRATLIDTALVGTGQWTINNPGSGARILALDPLNLAPRQPRFENRDALLADFEGGKPGLLVDETGRHSLALDWTARGDPGPDGLRFDLKAPACAIASLEVNLPKDRILGVSPDGCLVSGPNPAESADRRLWRIGFAGKAQIYLTIRRTEPDASMPPLVLAEVRTVQELTPDGVLADFKFDLKTPRQEVRELRCECDPALRLYEVRATGLEHWEVRAGATVGAPAILSIHFHEPWRGGALNIRALASLMAPTWTSPRLRLFNAVPRGETLVLRVHPDVRLQDWRPGDFILTRATTDTDGTQVLTLASGGLDSSANIAPARPSATIQASGVEYRTRQVTWWRVQPEMSSLTTQLTYEVDRGQLLQLPLALPADWKVERVELNQSDLLRYWEVRQDKGATLVVHLRKPLGPATTGMPIRLTVRLVSSQRGQAAEWAFPDVAPLGVAFREGALAVSFDGQDYRPSIAASAPAADPLPNELGPWGKQVPDFYYPYLGKAITGTLRLQARSPRVNSRCTSEVVLAAGRAALIAHLDLRPEIGSPDIVELAVSAPAAGKWTWKTVQGDNQVRSFEPLPTPELLRCLGALAAASSHPLSTFGFRLLSENRQPMALRWRLKLAKPLREPLRLDAICEPRLSGDGKRWDVPLLSLQAPNRMEGEVTLYLAGAETIRVEMAGLRETASGPNVAKGDGTIKTTGTVPFADAISPWRTFRYGALPAFLSLHGAAPLADPDGAAVIDRAHLTTYVEPNGRLVHHLAFLVWNWKQQTLPLRLSAGARLLAARVDGRWLSQLPPAEVMDGALLAKLPVPRVVARSETMPQRGSAVVGAWHRFEIAYAQDEPSWRMWTHVETPPSILPVAPISFRRTWRLPPGVVPLLDTRYRCLPSVGHDQADDDGRLPFPLSWAWPRAPRRWPLAADWQTEQRQRMTDAAAALVKNRDARPMTLGEMVDRLVFEQFKDGEPLILDAVALRDAGLGPLTPLPATVLGDGAPPWEPLGLVYVPCQPSPLLTTKREADAWQTAARLAGRASNTAPSEAMTDAVAEATIHGHDRSGRFLAAASWLRDRGVNGPGASDTRTSTESGNALDAALGLLHAESWTEWEPIAGADVDAPLLVVRRDALSGVGIVAAVLLCVLFWRLPGGAGLWRLGMLLAWLAAAGLGFLWLPVVLRPLTWWPLLGGAIVALAWYLGSVASGQKTVGSRQKAEGSKLMAQSGNEAAKIGGLPAATGVLLLLLLLPTAYCLLPLDCLLPTANYLLATASGADAPSEETVFVVPGGDPDKPTVLAPPALLDRLNKMARQTAVPARGAVLVSASYDGKMVEGEAEIKAEFQVHCFGDEPTTLLLPLDGVKLDDEVLLDGARAHIEVARPPQVGYALKVEKHSPPLHKINMRFRVRVTAAGDDRDVQFTVPSLIQGRLTFEQPAGASYLQALTGQLPVRGAQRLTAGPAPRLEADLGRLSAPLHIHWRQERQPARPASVRVKEAYLWDLRADASTLTGVLAYTVSQGAVSALAVDVPGRLEVLSVAVEAPSARAPVRLKDWRLTGKDDTRRLQVEFQGPVTGDVRLTLQLAPRQAFAARDTLPLPAPRAARSDQRWFAYQTNGLVAHVPEHVGLAEASTRDFASLWKAAGRVPERASWLPMKAYTFARGASGQALLQVRLRPATLEARAEQRFTWHIGPRQADFQATARITARDGDLALVQWDVPPEVTITAVTGPDIRSWSRVGPRVQAWLRGSRVVAEARMTGYRTLTDGRFQLPCLPIVSASPSVTSIRLIAIAGMALTAPEPRGLLPLPDPQTSEQELGYVTSRPRYGGSFRLAQASASADARILTIADLRERQLAFVAAVDYQVRQGGPRRVVVELRNWERGQAKLELLDATRPPQPQQHGAIRAWVVDLAPGPGERYRMILTGALPLEGIAGGVSMPEVSVSGAARVERWLAVGSPAELATEGARGLKPWNGINAPLPFAAWWPREAEQLRRLAGPVWRVTADDWSLRLVPRARPAGATAVRVLLTEQAAAVVDGRHWLYQTTYWLYQENSIDLQVVMPRASRLRTVTLDDRPVPRSLARAQARDGERSPESGRLWLSLPGGAAAHRLRLRWRYDDDAEPLDRPLLSPPRLLVAGSETMPQPSPVLWTVDVPTGYQSVAEQNGTSSGAALTASAAGQDLRRAEALLQLSSLLAARIRPNSPDAPLALAQKRFYHYCRYAEHELDINSQADVGPGGQSLRDWLQAMRDQNGEMARKHGFEPLRAEAERQARKGLYGSLPVAALDADEARAGEATRLEPWLGDSLPDQGTPMYWHNDAGAAPPHLVLTTTRAQHRRQALGSSLLVVVVLLTVWVLAQFPSIRGWARVFWPEQMALLGCLVWQGLGPSLVVLFLVLLGVCARAVYLVQCLLGWLRRPAAAASQPSV
jgi:hypothetical protein